VVQDFIQEAFEGMVVHDGKHAERTVIQLVGGYIAGEACQRFGKVVRRNVVFSFFFPPPPPSSE
jgi:hypothetical protein